MEEISKMAIAYYINLPDEKKQEWVEFFKSMASDDHGQIIFPKFAERLKEYPWYSSFSLFTELDKDKNGTLDFNEFITFFFIDKRGTHKCDNCSVFLLGSYFTCLQCFNPNNTYDLCAACYGDKNKIAQIHHKDAVFIDTYTLLDVKRREDQTALARVRNTALAPVRSTALAPVRSTALAYYANLTESEKQLAKSYFNSMDANKDETISLHEFTEFLGENYATFATSDLFKALDKDGNGSLDFEEVITFYYLVKCGRLNYCDGCGVFLNEVYFTCTQCFLSSRHASYDLCCSCYGGKNFNHHTDAVFSDNFSLLRQSRSLVTIAEEKNKINVVKAVNVTSNLVNATSNLVDIAGQLSSTGLCSIL